LGNRQPRKREAGQNAAVWLGVLTAETVQIGSVRLTIPAAALVMLAWLPAGAHVAPSELENNRYILLAPLGDRVRLAYTVYMGQVPGRTARGRMDRDRDGRISDAEADEYGRQLAAQSAPRLSLVVDGRALALDWDEVDVGLGEPVTDGGAFAVDLVEWICLDQPRQRLTHRVELRDSFHIPDPGETELRAEESPGVRITRSDLGGPGAGRSRPRLDHRWMGGPGPAESEGYHLAFEVDPALATFAGACGAASPSGARSGWLAAAAAAMAALALVAALLVRRRRRRRRQKMNG
jgi:hypothetical protein